MLFLTIIKIKSRIHKIHAPKKIRRIPATILPSENLVIGESGEVAVLKMGSSGSQVRTLQTKLNNWGYNAGKVDGTGITTAIKTSVTIPTGLPFQNTAPSARNIRVGRVNRGNV